MEKLTGNENAFPLPKEVADHIINGYGFPAEYLGLTIRQHFATLAMQGLIANTDVAQIFKGNNGIAVPNEIAKVSIQMADALIAELNKK